MTASGGAGEESEMPGESAAGTRRATNAVAAPARPLRGDAPAATALLWGITCVACVLAAWFIATAGEAEARFISPAMLPSPAETLRELPRVFGERKLVANTVRTLARVCLGFGLTAYMVANMRTLLLLSHGTTEDG